MNDQSGNWLRMGSPALLAAVLFGVAARQVEAGTVTSLADSGPGSLREAIANAPPGETISFSVTGTIILTSGELLVTNNLTIAGPGPGKLAVDGNARSRVFQICSNAVASIFGLTITNGRSYTGGGIYNCGSTLTVSNCTICRNSSPDAFGGGIFNSHGGIGLNATLTIVNSTITGNGVAGGDGGGIYNFGLGDLAEVTLTIAYSTISGNSALLGGGIYNISAALLVTNSTISGNTTLDGGSAIENVAGGYSATLTVAGSTVSGNFANGIGGNNSCIFNYGYDGTATVAIVNSTLSGNRSPAAFTPIGIWNQNNWPPAGTVVEIGSSILDVGGSGHSIFDFNPPDFNVRISSLGYNLSSDNGGGFLTDSTDLTNLEPLLDPLQNNGGPTLTHALLRGSPAIDRGTNFTAALADQRDVGFARTFDNLAIANAPGGDGTDIGAFEAQNRPPVAICREMTVSAGPGCAANASVDGGSFDPDGDAITTSQAPPGPYLLGTNQVTLTVTDLYGASNTCTALVVVQDTTPPQIVCPADVVTNATSAAGAVVRFAPVISDNCCSASFSCNPPSGTSFPVGDTVVTCVAVDWAGRTNTCAFTVRVNPLPDSDGDGVPDYLDQCPDTAPGAIVDASGCSIGQLVPCWGPVSGGTWKNHGQYVRAVIRAANDFLNAGLMNRRQWAQTVRQAAHSRCGWNRKQDRGNDRDWHRDWDLDRDCNWGNF